MLFLSLLSCRAAPEPPPDIVLLLVAGLRSDAGVPLLEALGRTPSASFSAAYSQSPAPFVSMGSLLVGDYPSAVPMCGLTVRSGPLPEEPVWCNQLPEARWSMPEILAAYGYRTALISSHLRGGKLLAGEFQIAHESTALAEDAASWWAADDRPRLLVVVDTAPMMRQTALWAAQRSRHGPGSMMPGRTGGEPRTEPKEAELAAYQAEVRALGGRLGALLDGIDGEELVIVAGLNGINLGEQSGSPALPRVSMFNDIILERTVHVPLMVLSGAEGAADHAEVVELIDVLPTVLSAAGVEPPADLPGRSLLTGTLEETPHAYSEFGDMLSVRSGSYRLSYRGMLHHGSTLDLRLTQVLMGDPRWLLLHDVVNDPAQGSSIETQPEATAQLLETLRTIRTGAAAPPRELLTPENLEALEAVQRDGYW